MVTAASTRLYTVQRALIRLEREFKMAHALGLYQRGGISLWKAASLAGISLQEMARYAAAQGLRAPGDEEMVSVELA